MRLLVGDYVRRSHFSLRFCFSTAVTHGVQGPHRRLALILNPPVKFASSPRKMAFQASF
jgi:hypothetical protein